MVDREKIAKQKVTLEFSQLLGYEFDEITDFDGLTKGGSLDTRGENLGSYNLYDED